MTGDLAYYRDKNEAFHDEVLGAGALPLQELEERIDAWIAKTK